MSMDDTWTPTPATEDEQVDTATGQEAPGEPEASAGPAEPSPDGEAGIVGNSSATIAGTSPSDPTLEERLARWWRAVRDDLDLLENQASSELGMVREHLGQAETYLFDHIQRWGL